MNIKPIPGYPGFEVSDTGEMFSTRRGSRRILSPCPGSDGYLVCCYKKDGVTHNVPVHRSVLTAFVGPRPDGMTASHLNGDPLDNRLDNLRWESMKENLGRKHEHGTIPRGSRNGSAKLSERDVLDIRERLAAGESYASIGRDYGVNYVTIRWIDRKKTWGWLEKKIPAGVGGKS